ncbi:DinB family protein [Fodinibius sediminis]|uniref:Uncharacterized damage-inducible protein DinB (Forms a four-helix bundle) n=1 Tax=Fodinibius sediminis TaxID=1214077 RepID=A0A521AS48_9BACT|nr:DinB family protein [Fodinibius sediminis]SMO37591.1 Uncharacterized damage-inducible protein DinB (forms a four-helix bundle) [Fodinibius sediminis]
MEPVDQQLLRLYSYDFWANNQIWTSLRTDPDFPGCDEAINYYSHIAGTQEVWHARIQGRSTEGLEVWPNKELAQAHKTLKTYSPKWARLIKANNSALDRPISYHNSQGEPFDTRLSDILHHIVIHGQHHRAQIARLLRKAGLSPPPTDFIFFCRAN